MLVVYCGVTVLINIFSLFFIRVVSLAHFCVRFPTRCSVRMNAGMYELSSKNKCKDPSN